MPAQARYSGVVVWVLMALAICVAKSMCLLVVVLVLVGGEPVLIMLTPLTLMSLMRADAFHAVDVLEIPDGKGPTHQLASTVIEP